MFGMARGGKGPLLQAGKVAERSALCLADLGEEGVQIIPRTDRRGGERNRHHDFMQERTGEHIPKATRGVFFFGGGRGEKDHHPLISEEVSSE